MEFGSHPLFVHLPMALCLLMPLVAAGTLLGWWKGYFHRRVWVVTVSLQLVLLVSAVTAIRSGEIDELEVAKVVAREHIDVHESAATLFTYACLGGLIIMVAPMFIRREERARWVAVAATTAACIVAALGFRVGEAGGSLVYRHGATKAHIAAPSAPPPPDAGHTGAPRRAPAPGPTLDAPN